MAFALRGCGVVLKSDIERRDKVGPAGALASPSHTTHDAHTAPHQSACGWEWVSAAVRWPEPQTKRFPHRMPFTRRLTHGAVQALAKLGRSAHEPIVSAYFIHSVRACAGVCACAGALLLVQCHLEHVHRLRM